MSALTPQRRMAAMDAVVAVLEDEGVRHAFGIPGAAILPLYDALRKSTLIRHLSVRHEEGGTHAADGYARITGDVGICIGTSGPAGTNMITGLYTAIADSIPIICITGQAPTAVLHREAFQAVDIVEIARPVTKWAYQVREPAQLPWAFRRAFRIAREGRPGPVLLDLPLDIQNAGDIPYDVELDSPLAVSRQAPAPAAVERVIELVLAAERPLLMPGGGVLIANASPALRELAELLQVPVTPTLMGKGSFPEDHPLHVGTVGIQTSQPHANALFLESDLVVAIGARFADRHTGALDVYRGERTFIHIDVDPLQIGRVLPADVGIVSDAGLALEALVEEARRRGAPLRASPWPERVAELRAELVRRTDHADVPVRAPRVFGEINEFFDDETVFVTAIGLYQIWSGQLQRVRRARHYLCCGQAGPLGWEVPACLGAKLAAPERQVVGVVGDYSFQFLAEEVAVAVQYGVPFVLVMINNAYMGLIRQAEQGYDMNFEVDLAYDGHRGAEGIDHVALMEAMGAAGVRVTAPEGLRDAFAWAVDESNRRRIPVLVEVITDREENAAMGLAIDAVREFDQPGQPVPVGA